MRLTSFGVLVILALANVPTAAAQQATKAGTQATGAVTAAGAPLPSDYLIGPADVLSIVFWRDKEMSADVTVRPDGKISLPLLNEVGAAGFTPEELRARLTEAAGKFIADPDVAVVVKDIKSRNVYITGKVTRPATYPLNTDMTVLQLIAVAGGLLEYADQKNIVVIRIEKGHQQIHKFNYKDVISQKRTADNISLKPGDTVVVP